VSFDENGDQKPTGAGPVARFSAVEMGIVVALGVVALVVTGVAATARPSRSADDYALVAEQAVAAGTGDGSAGAAPAADPTIDQSGASPVSTEVATVGPDPGAAANQGAAAGQGDPGPVVVPPGVRVASSWVADVARSTGIPARALQAYGDAVLTLASQDPGCRLGWPTLAGIGEIESGHGRVGLQADGHPAAPIVGPALDGTGGKAAIHSTPQSVAWHGDPVWDHAVGPMQFIPSTWERWAADGDGDGIADPQDIDDASLATARYLCAGNRDMSTAAGWQAGVYSYNHSDAYVQKVFATASSYARAAG
jgi:membrane-bound lytic murein transglycosylase B